MGTAGCFKKVRWNLLSVFWSVSSLAVSAGHVSTTCVQRHHRVPHVVDRWGSSRRRSCCGAQLGHHLAVEEPWCNYEPDSSVRLQLLSALPWERCTLGECRCIQSREPS